MKKVIVAIGLVFALIGCGDDGGSSTDNTNSTEAFYEAFYAFDETSGADVLNSSFDELHGVIVAAQRVPGKIGSALSFSENLPSYVDFPTYTNSSEIEIEFSNDFIDIEAWVMFESLEEDTTYHFFGNSSTTGIQRFALQVSDSQFQFLIVPELNGRLETDGTELIKSDFDFDLNTWYHIAFTYDELEAKFYVNGELNEQRSITVNLFKYVNQLYLGGSRSANSFPGTIDELRFSLDIRTDEDIRAYYDSTK